MKSIYLIFMCLCLSCNLSDAPPVTQISTADVGEDLTVQKDQGNDNGEDVTIRTAPQASNYIPADGAVDVEKNTKVSFAVDKVLDETTVTSESFSLSDQSGQQIESASFFDPASKTVILVPTAPLSLLNVYTASFTKDITDLEGTPIAAGSWSFTIVDGTWQTPELLEVEDGNAIDPKVATDSAGNGAAVVWSQYLAGRNRLETSHVLVSHFEPGMGWSKAGSIGDGMRDEYTPNLNFDSEGQLVAVWRQKGEVVENTTPNSPWSNRFTTEWGTPVQLEETQAVLSNIQLANDAFGNTTALWFSYRDERIHVVTRRLQNNSWTPAFDIKTFPIGGGGGGAMLGIGGTGHGFAGWTELGRIHTSRYTKDVGWGIPNGQTPQGSSSPKIVMNKKGNAVLVWRQADAGINLWASQFVDNQWSQPFKIVDNSSGDSVRNPAVAFNENGDAYVVWIQNESLFGSQLQEDGSWSTPEVLDNAGSPKDPIIKLDNFGHAFVVWATGSQALKVKRYTKNEGWTDSLDIEQARNADLAITPSGKAVLVWEAETGVQQSSIMSAIFN